MSEAAKKLNAGTKAAFIFIMAITGGFMWRVRGDDGYGSMWGMFAVGVMFTLVIFTFFGNCEKMSCEALPIAVILLGITNGAWGTLNKQMGGFLSSSIPFDGEAVQRTVPLNPFAGLSIMLLLGFGLIPLFSLYIGSLFSEKKYKFKHYLMLIAIFYAVSFLFRFFFSHHIMRYFYPQATQMFVEGLADKGCALSPSAVYTKNLGSAAWAVNIPFGRNYFAQVKAISQSAAALASSIALLVIMRDKTAAKISFLFNLVSAVSITSADVFLIMDAGAGFFAKADAPAFIKIEAWSLWEYFTGFLLGLGMAAILVFLPESVNCINNKVRHEKILKNRKLRMVYGAVLSFTFTFGLTVARPIGRIIAEKLEKAALISNKSKVEIVLTAVLCILCLIPSVITARKNMIIKELPNPIAISTKDFCMRAAPVYFGITGFLYFFMGNAYLVKFPFSRIKNFSAFAEILKNGGNTVTLIMIISFLMFYLVYFTAYKKAVQK